MWAKAMVLELATGCFVEYKYKKDVRNFIKWTTDCSKLVSTYVGDGVGGGVSGCSHPKLMPSEAQQPGGNPVAGLVAFAETSAELSNALHRSTFSVSK